MAQEKLMIQKEIDLNGCEVKTKTIICNCKKKNPPTVVLQRAVDPTFWIGQCGRCDKKHSFKEKSND